MTVRAPTVVVAAGALDTPAVLLRSGIGGPAAGDYLRLHPATAVAGVYDAPQKAWWGPPQSGLSMAMVDLEDGYGYLIETSHASPGVSGAAFPWHGGEAHKEIMAASPATAAFVFLIRDHGHGRVTIDAAGNPVHLYDFDGPLDRRVFAHGLEEVVRLHRRAARSASRRSTGGSSRGSAAAASRSTTSRRACARRRSSRTTTRRSASTTWGRRAWARTRRRASRTAGASCTTRPACGSATRAASRPRRGRTRC